MMSSEVDVKEQSELDRFKKAIGERIKAIRLANGKTQEDAAGLQIALKTYYRIEKGQVGANMQSIFFICKNIKPHPKEIFADIPFNFS